MRVITCLFATAFVASLNPTYVHAQSGEEQVEPYHKHHDMRHGHDHVYPDRGAIVRDVPRGAVVVNYAGVAYRFDNGVWYEPRGPAFVVVDPPIGLIVPALPGFSTPVVHGAETLLYANNVYYRARPELGGYEVVNDPTEGQSAGRSGTASGEAAAGASGTPGAAKGSAALVAAVPIAAAPAIATSGYAVPATAGPAIATSGAAGAAAAAPAIAASGAAIPLGALPAVTTSGPVPASALAGSGSTLAATSAAPATTAMSANAALAANSGAVATPSAALAGGPSGTQAAVPIVAAAAPAPAPPPPTAVASPPASATAALPAAPSSVLSLQQGGPKVFIYPRSGQNSDQQARDRYECYRFAVAQTGVDPMRVNGGAPRAEQQSDYERAQAACLEGRGYSVR